MDDGGPDGTGRRKRKGSKVEKVDTLKTLVGYLKTRGWCETWKGQDRSK